MSVKDCNGEQASSIKSFFAIIQGVGEIELILNFFFFFESIRTHRYFELQSENVHTISISTNKTKYFISAPVSKKKR